MAAPNRPAPFLSAEAAWFWTAAALRAANDPLAARPGPAACRPEDVVKCLDDLYRRIWHEALERLEHRLRAQGIVAGPILQDAAD
jgi:hypothetical protein